MQARVLNLLSRDWKLNSLYRNQKFIALKSEAIQNLHLNILRIETDGPDLILQCYSNVIPVIVN